MKVKDISSFFQKKGEGSKNTAATSSPQEIEVPSRKTSKKGKKKLEVEFEPHEEEERSVSDEEDPRPKSLREKDKKKKEQNGKRKARVLSDSEDEEEEEKARKKEDEKKQQKKKRMEEESSFSSRRDKRKEKVEEPPKQYVDPKDFFSTQKVKQERKPADAKKEKENGKGHESREEQRAGTSASMKKEGKIRTPDKKEEDKIESKSPRTPKVKREPSTPTRSSPRKHAHAQKKEIKQEQEDDDFEDFNPKKKESKKKEETSKPKKEIKQEKKEETSKQKKEIKQEKKSHSKPSTSTKRNAEVSDESDFEDFNPKQKGKGKGKESGAQSRKSDSDSKKSTSPKKKEGVNDDEKEKQRKQNFLKFVQKRDMKPKNLGAKVIPKGTPDCLKGLTFVITGNLDSLERDAAKTLVEKHGGRLTSAVSGKTSYLIVGDEPGASKTAKAEKMNIPLIDEDKLLDMIRQSMPDEQPDEEEFEMMDIGGSDDAEEEKVQSPPKQEAKSPAVASPPKKDKKREKSASPKKPTGESTSSKPISKTDLNANEEKAKEVTIAPPQIPKVPSLMWVDKYKPRKMQQIVGQVKDGSNAKKLVKWLRNWFNYHGAADEKVKAANPFTRDPEGTTFKCALLSGPPGIGKTTSAHLACKEVGYDYFELNASDTRNKRGLHENVADCLSNRTMFGNTSSALLDLTRKHVLIMDEVDGMSGNEDRGGVQELIALIKKSRIPIICICNDRNHPKIRSLANYCFDLKFNKPTVQELKGFICSVAFKEGIKLDSEKMMQLCISTDQDVRQILHQLELYKESNASRILDPRKDLRFGPWDVCRKVFHKTEHKDMNIHEKTSLFFQDYSIGPLFVQENYPKWRPARAKNNTNARNELIARTASSIADGDLIDSIIRRSNNWSMLPVQALFSSYIPGQLMESDTCGMIEFPQWLGKNSTKGKRHRMLQALHTHVHLEVSGSLEALNMDYLPYMRRKICGNLVDGSVEEAAEVMEKYALVRDDVDAILELSLWPGGGKNPMEKVDTKTKTAFTRLVNKEVLPYSTEKGGAAKRGRRTTLEEEYGEEEAVEEESEDEAPEKDAMIKMKAKKSSKGGKKKDKDAEAAGPSKPKKKRN